MRAAAAGGVTGLGGDFRISEAGVTAAARIAEGKIGAGPGLLRPWLQRFMARIVFIDVQ